MKKEKFYEAPHAEVLQLVSEQIFAASGVTFENEDYELEDEDVYEY